LFTVSVVGPDGTKASQDVVAKREKPTPLMSLQNLGIDKNSVQPKADVARVAGDLIEFSVRATPGARVTALIGDSQKNIVIPMLCPSAVKKEANATPAARGNMAAKIRAGNYGVNPGLSVAYGQAFQHLPAHREDYYVGVYRLQPEDNFVDAPVTFKIARGGAETTAIAAAKITAIKQPMLARTLSDETIVRTAPDAGRLTPLPGGVRLLVDGYDGENIRCLYRHGLHVWIKKSEIEMEDAGSPAPTSLAKTIVVKDEADGEKVVIPLTQRLPYTIEQSLNPSRLTLKIYGVSGDTDWIYHAPPNSAGTSMVENVTWKQPDDGTYEVTVDLKSGRQWGFAGSYGEASDSKEISDHALVLHIKNAPQISGRLNGLKVCVDPGHGGSEPGAIGPSGVREAQINLAIALKLRDQLTTEGATVYMTREDDSDVSLNDRVDMARKKNADLLISIHNNALPDGRDPILEHGTSTYYYHPQSKKLAEAIEAAVSKGCALKPIGARYQNLALCRPSYMQAVLVEVGFVVNPDEYAELIDDSFQQKAAVSIKNGLLGYFSQANNAQAEK
jgi:N-acetylmuramoyl-L-alanine amidase